MAIAANHKDLGTVRAICEDLRRGADIGTRGANLCPSTSTNAPSAFEFGDRVTDAIVDGIKKKIMIGPMKWEEVTALNWPGIKVNGIMVRLKETGKARIILNMSKGEPFDVNGGMNCDGRFRVTMSSTKRWARALRSAGRGAWLTKIDWEAAYKNIKVLPSDIRLQFFKWGGRWFAETNLVFGAASSVGLYDRLAKLVLAIVTHEAGFPEEQCQQIIDDVVACGSKEEVLRFHSTYHGVAAKLGVKLAVEDDPTKAFSATQEGEIFGVTYNTKNMTWSLRAGKMGTIIDLIRTAEASGALPAGSLRKLSGKLVHYAPLVPNSRWFLGQLVGATGAATDIPDGEVVQLGPWLLADLQFWRTMLPFSGGRALVDDPDYRVWPGALTGDSDASGKGEGERGIGAVLGASTWAFMGLGGSTRGGAHADDGKELQSKMSVWELCGPLVLLIAAEHEVEGKQLRVMVDNIGAVYAYRKGWSNTCDLLSTVAKATAVVAMALQCELEVVKVTRCSTKGAKAADALSRGDRKGHRSHQPQAARNQSRTSRVLRKWLEKPTPDGELGTRIVQEMGRQRSDIGLVTKFV